MCLQSDNISRRGFLFLINYLTVPCVTDSHMIWGRKMCSVKWWHVINMIYLTCSPYILVYLASTQQTCCSCLGSKTSSFLCQQCVILVCWCLEFIFQLLSFTYQYLYGWNVILKTKQHYCRLSLQTKFPCLMASDFCWMIY